MTKDKHVTYLCSACITCLSSNSLKTVFNSMIPSNKMILGGCEVVRSIIVVIVASSRKESNKWLVLLASSTSSSTVVKDSPLLPLCAQ